MSTPPPPSRSERRAHRRGGPIGRLQDLDYGLIRWLLRHVQGFYAALGVYLLVGLGFATAGLALFALLAQVVFGGTVQRWDEAGVLWARTLENDFLDILALIGVALGSGAAAWAVIIVGSVFLWRSKHHYSVYLLWLALGGARFLNTALKDWYGRPRPSLFPGDVEILGMNYTFPASPSFPSGHALTSTVIFFTLAYLIARLEPTRRMRRWTVATAAFFVLLVCASRVYLAVHYPSDVIAGFLAGIFWATFTALGIELVRYFRTRKPELAEEEQDLEKGVEPLREALTG